MQAHIEKCDALRMNCNVLELFNARIMIRQSTLDDCVDSRKLVTHTEDGILNAEHGLQLNCERFQSL